MSSQLLERRSELARIESALADARAGRGTFVVVEGPAGIGKTAVLTAARSAAADSGMRVLRSRGTELEHEFAFGVVRQLFEPLLAEAGEPERTELLHAAAGVAAGLLGLPGGAAPDSSTSSGVDPSFAILHGLYWLCANLAATGPLCLVVDDAQWADAPSLRFLAFLLTRLEELDVALVVAARPRETGTDAALLATVAADPSAEVIRLPPLTRTAVAQFVESSLPGVPDPSFVDACLRATRGTPFLMRELMDGLREGGIPSSADGARDVERIGARTIGRSIRLRLGRLPEPAGRVARALAILEQSELHLAARFTGLGEVETEAAVELLATAGILDSGRPLAFSHPIVRASLYGELSAAERAQGHLRAARLLAEEPGARERVAQHLLASEPSGDRWVFERLVEAGYAAARNGAPESAALFLRRALTEPPPPAAHQSLLLALGKAEESAGLEGWPEHLRRAVEAAPNAVEAAEATRVLASALNRSQRFAEAVEVLDRAAAALGTQDEQLALQLEAAAVVVGMNDLLVSPTVALRRSALRDRAVSDPAMPHEALAAAALISILMNEPADVGASLANRALLVGESGLSASTFARTALSLLWAERYDQVQPLLDASIAHARVTGDSGRLAVGLGARGWLALRRGDLISGGGDARTAFAATELPAPPIYRLLNGGLLVGAHVALGELDEAEAVLAAFGDAVESGSLTATVLKFARAELRFEQGRLTEALDDFLGVGSRLTRALVTSPGYLPWRSGAALVQLALGDRQHAGRLAEEELELARKFGMPRALGVSSRVAGIVAGGDRGEQLLREAVDSFERCDVGLERARALTDLGAMLRRRNRRTEARELLREALDVAHRGGATLLAARAETELRATGARPRRVMLAGLDSLTASERRIAEYASEGLTNREIAQTLFITTRTVEGHLTSIFRKLQLSSRNELHAVLATGAPVSVIEGVAITNTRFPSRR